LAPTPSADVATAGSERPDGNEATLALADGWRYRVVWRAQAGVEAASLAVEDGLAAKDGEDREQLECASAVAWGAPAVPAESLIGEVRCADHERTPGRRARVSDDLPSYRERVLDTKCAPRSALCIQSAVRVGPLSGV